MSRIRVVWGTATGPTAMASYDAALADAGVHNYNLVAVSSVIPAGVPVDPVGTAPDLGPAGERLTVVEARATAAGPCRVTACLGWSSAPDGPGLFYEASEADRLDDPEDATVESPPDAVADGESVEKRVREGLAAGRGLREWTFDGERVETVAARAERGTYATAVVLAAYGRSEPLC